MEGIKNKAYAYILELHQRLTMPCMITLNCRCSKRSVHGTYSTHTSIFPIQLHCLAGQLTLQITENTHPHMAEKRKC